MAAQVVVVRGKEYFVCSYTGALIAHHYFIPHGKNLSQRTGCFATLPILLRSVLDEEQGEFTERFQKIKHDCEIFFTQPDIPVQPPLPADQCPVGSEAFVEYLEVLDLGLSWTLVPNSVAIPKKKKTKKQKTKN